MTRPVALSVVLALVAAVGSAQLGERPGTSNDTSLGPKDLSGLSVKVPRLKVMHTTDPDLAGGSMYFQTYDPYLAYKLGKDFTQREFRVRDGVFASSGSTGIASFKGGLSDPATPAIVGNDQVSCGGCHNIPYRDAGGGTNFAKKSGVGRNATHFFGSGIQEMIAWQVRQKMMQQIDDNRNNVVDRDEMDAEPILVLPSPDALRPIDYGRSADLDGDGWPDLNNIFRVWFVDGNGQVVVDAAGLDDERVAGYDFILEVFGWGEQRFNLNTTNRVFVWDPLVGHGGLDAYDPTTAYDPDFDGWSQVSNAGFQQAWIGHIPTDPGVDLGPTGLSMDDPDGDGYVNEITEGDLDLAEWYLLNSPRPGLGRQNEETERGEQVFFELGCDSCHVMEWYLEPADPTNPDIHQRYLGDLRFFDLDVAWDDESGRMQGRLIPLYDLDGDGRHVRRREGFLVQGIGSDFRFWDMGIRFNDMQYDGGMVRSFRTGLLWGNGATGFPWGHDGLSFTLDDVIRRHGGDARVPRGRYERASEEDRDALVAWLMTFQLYSTELLPVDVDGDGQVAENHLVAGRYTGYERFNAEWLFRNPGEVEGWIVNPEGEWVFSSAIENVVEAYGLDLPYLADSDADSFVDLQDPCPGSTGFRNGCD